MVLNTLPCFAGSAPDGGRGHCGIAAMDDADHSSIALRRRGPRRSLLVHHYALLARPRRRRPDLQHAHRCVSCPVRSEHQCMWNWLY